MILRTCISLYEELEVHNADFAFGADMLGGRSFLYSRCCLNLRRKAQGNTTPPKNDQDAHFHFYTSTMFEFISRIFTSGSTVPEAAPQPAQEGRSEFIKPVKRKKVHMPPSPCEDTKRIAYDPFPWTSTIEGTIKIDPRGEVTLLIGNEERRFRVSRCAMRLGSPVWKKMFSGHFAEAESDVVKFPADDTEPMQVLLLIAHAQHQRLPDRLTLQQIASVAQVADKYEMAPKAKIFIENWIDKIDPGIRKHGWDFEYSEDPGKVMADGYAFIWIGWALRNSFIFYEGLHYVIWCTPPVHLAEDVELPPGCRGSLFMVPAGLY